jgi:hypothetical protein
MRIIVLLPPDLVEALEEMKRATEEGKGKGGVEGEGKGEGAGERKGGSN